MMMIKDDFKVSRILVCVDNYICLAYARGIMVTTELMLEDETAIVAQYVYAPIKCVRAVLGRRLIEGETYNE